MAEPNYPELSDARGEMATRRAKESGRRSVGRVQSWTPRTTSPSGLDSDSRSTSISRRSTRTTECPDRRDERPPRSAGPKSRSDQPPADDHRDSTGDRDQRSPLSTLTISSSRQALNTFPTMTDLSGGTYTAAEADSFRCPISWRSCSCSSSRQIHIPRCQVCTSRVSKRCSTRSGFE